MGQVNAVNSTAGDWCMSHLGVHRNRRTELIIFDCDGVLIDSEIIAATVITGNKVGNAGIKLVMKRHL